jgi:tRNA pseudouridine32 synthase/23S rRNA pseudouridine746 synthase
MMKGMEVQNDTNLNTTVAPVIIYEDDVIIVVEKPSGMPSVPGLDGKKSLQEWLCEHYAAAQSDTGGSLIHAVHRLDMDTSGVMVFAKTQLAAVNLRRQFEEHTVRKIYMAKVSARFRSLPTQSESKGNRLASIDLPLSPDYDERPRQKVDFKQGKEAHTEYEIIKEYADGTADLLLYPHTGRTHQLRVHCAHTLGLGRPILGDLLYGAHTVRLQTDASAQPSRLCLHALSITFRHPDTDATLTFTSKHLCY